MTDTPLADTEFRILLVEDDPTNRMIMERLVERIPGCHAVSFAHPIDLIAALDKVEFDVAIVDYQLPGLNGIELIKEIHQHPAHTDKPMVIVTADKDRDTRIEALTSGAVDFLNKPLEIVEFKARVRNLTKLAEAQRKLSMRAEWLKEEVDRATTELRKRGEEIVHRLILASEYKDLDTAMHTLRMANFCELIAEELGMSMEFRRDLKMAAPMHDIGKVGIPDSIMLKRGPSPRKNARKSTGTPKSAPASSRAPAAGCCRSRPRLPRHTTNAGTAAVTPMACVEKKFHLSAG